jgi:putative ABC transport system permease protein
MLSSILRSVFYYRRVNIVVAMAVAISTAVIGGAMIVGDSVRYSLREMTRQRLGEITHVIHGRFVREQLAQGIAEQSDADVAPALLLTAGFEIHHGDQIARAGSVGITGVDLSGWEFFDTGSVTVPTNDEIILGYRCASELDATIGDTVSVWVELPTSIPRDSLLGEREEVSAELQFTVRDILAESVGASRFTLNPGQQLPLNAFVSLSTLQDRLGLQAVEQSRRNPIAKPAMVNTMLIHSNESEPDALESAVVESLTLDDLALRLRIDAEHGYVSAETDRMILETPVSDGVIAAADQLGLQTAPTLVYLINEFAAADRESSRERYSMYSIIAGVPLDRTTPLGPFGPAELAPDEVVISPWLADDLEVQVGDRITARWHEVGSHGELPEVHKSFEVVRILPEDDPVSIDEGLTPFIAGVTDVDSFSDWDQPFEMETDRITGRDDAFWAEHRATPKAFVALETAQELWRSRYGSATSIRIAADVYPLPKDRLQAIVDQLEDRIPRRCNLVSMGLSPLPILDAGLKASVGANDFTQLFGGFSFFLILSAIILISLMFRLGIQQRASQAGLLHAIGFPVGHVRWFFLGEGLLVALGGAIPGIFLAVGFAKLMIYGLTTWWNGAIGTRFLLLDIDPIKLGIAAGVSMVLAAGAIWFAIAALRRSSVRSLLAGKFSEALRTIGASRLMNAATAASLLCGLVLPAVAAGGLLPSGEAFSGLTWNMVAFFLGGTGCLSGGLLLLRQLFQTTHATTSGRSLRRLSAFAMANAARNPWRSLMTAALIASATFLIVAVAAGRRNPLSEIPDRASGNGGFRLIGESSQPILRDINSEEGRIALNLQEAWHEAGLTDTATVYSFGMRPGDDASCVNLYQTSLPTLLGASDSFIERGGFRFADTTGDNPWTLLRQPEESTSDLPVIPVIGDMNTLMYSLKKGIGDVILFPDEQNPTAELHIAGMLDGSLFQGVLVMSQKNLQTIDPDVAGSRYFLAETDSPETADTLTTVLESGLNTWGMDTESVSERLAGFLAVQNTYLSTFQLLGGLGLLVGIFGLAVVMIRNVVERQGEIAMLRAVGFTGFRICRLVLIENFALLLWGILLGTASAFLAMLPHLLSTGADLQWRQLAIVLGTVTASGMLASIVAVRRAQKISIRDNLTIET